MSKNDHTYVIYFYELCSYTIPNVSTKCQTQRNLLFYFQTRHVSFSRPSVASYNLSPSSYSNFRQNTGTKMIRSGVIVNHAMSQKKNTCNRNTAFFLAIKHHFVINYIPLFITVIQQIPYLF